MDRRRRQRVAVVGLFGVIANETFDYGQSSPVVWLGPVAGDRNTCEAEVTVEDVESILSLTGKLGDQVVKQFKLTAIILIGFVPLSQSQPDAGDKMVCLCRTVAHLGVGALLLGKLLEE